ncbi:hypothetical protein [Thalassoglobus polymorphus]|uniref:Phage head-tail joining protein domain-containing protein n=1 Tax=Thalassoglobus polymorphus TaxID=2527994 RepID=A0A517QHE0_9PLAN|nr:hypothetical protein [Thalassoglobus polymorphus]QDT30932.1 hypothetical protein Mal48_01610 [Thalassoglobus polymorphus]QDT30977.1 hypothetical protein Mal48_02060 [Thalassoglobus polymorphus]
MSLWHGAIQAALDANQEVTGSDSVTYLATPADDPVELHKPTKTLEPRFLNYQEKLALETEVVDWIVKASDFISGGSFIAPNEGAEIIDSSGTMQKVYRVSRFESEPAWRYLDASESHVRIHTVLSLEVSS